MMNEGENQKCTKTKVEVPYISDSLKGCHDDATALQFLLFLLPRAHIVPNAPSCFVT